MSEPEMSFFCFQGAAPGPAVRIALQLIFPRGDHQQWKHSDIVKQSAQVRLLALRVLDPFRDALAEKAAHEAVLPERLHLASWKLPAREFHHGASKNAGRQA